MSKRKKNPSVPLILLTVTGVAVGGYALWQVFKAKPKKKTRNGKKTTGSELPPPPPPSKKKTEQLKASDREKLRALDYTINSDVVRRFQVDFNDVNEAKGELGESLLGNKTLDEDNDMGPNTREAMRLALEEVERRQIAWADLVLIYG